MLHLQVKQRKIFDGCMSTDEKETPIFEVLENSRPEDLGSTKVNFEELEHINKPIFIEHNGSVV